MQGVRKVFYTIVRLSHKIFRFKHYVINFNLPLPQHHNPINIHTPSNEEGNPLGYRQPPQHKELVSGLMTTEYGTCKHADFGGFIGFPMKRLTAIYICPIILIYELKGGQMRNKQVSLREEAILLNMPSKLLKRIDQYADKRGMNRSVAIRMILDEKLTEVEQVERKLMAG
jgi:hypothetical protein